MERPATRSNHGPFVACGAAAPGLTTGSVPVLGSPLACWHAATGSEVRRQPEGGSPGRVRCALVASQVRFGISCLVALMVLDCGRVINLT
jgi:hypothetical protein